MIYDTLAIRSSKESWFIYFFKDNNFKDILRTFFPQITDSNDIIRLRYPISAINPNV